MKLQYVVLSVDDVDRVKAWYVQYLELSVVRDRRDSFVLAGRGGGMLELRKGKPVDHPERVTLVFEVDEIKTVFKRIHDSKIRLGNQEIPYGKEVAALKDPAGHTVIVYTAGESSLKEELTVEGRPRAANIGPGGDVEEDAGREPLRGSGGGGAGFG